MQTFEYTIKDELGIHARPAGLLAKAAGKHPASVSVAKGEKTADMKRLFALMGLGVKKGDTVVVTIEGEGEEAAATEIKQVLEENL